jgi:hypothetical protein
VTLPLVLLVLVLAACAAQTDPLPTRARPAEIPTPTSTTTVGATSPPAAEAPAPGPLSSLDIRTCQTYVADRGAAHAWLVRHERRGFVAPGEFVAGARDLPTLATVAETTFLYQTEAPALVSALQAIIREGTIVASALASGAPVQPVPLRMALDTAATVCEQGGVPIQWFSG